MHPSFLRALDTWSAMLYDHWRNRYLFQLGVPKSCTCLRASDNVFWEGKHICSRIYRGGKKWRVTVFCCQDTHALHRPEDFQAQMSFFLVCLGPVLPGMRRESGCWRDSTPILTKLCGYLTLIRVHSPGLTWLTCQQKINVWKNVNSTVLEGCYFQS